MRPTFRLFSHKASVKADGAARAHERPSTALRSAFQLFARPKAETSAHALWAYSGSYAEIADEGTQRPPPSIGSPTLVWHIGIWPKAKIVELDKKMYNISVTLRDRIENYEKHNKRFFEDLGRTLEEMQRKGRVSGSAVRGLNLTRRTLAAEHLDDPDYHSFEVCQPQSLTFTLWWQDDAGPAKLNAPRQKPAAGDLRVRVQTQTHLDHATISFFIDAGKPWNGERVFSAAGAASGERRKRIFEYVELIKATAADQISQGVVDRDRLPERGVSPDHAAALRDAADYCYRRVWEDFAAAFGMGAVVAEKGETQFEVGEVFADFRSLVLAVDGLPTRAETERTRDASALRSGLGIAPEHAAHAGADATVGVGHFPRFDAAAGEPNTVLKGFWPFVRRMTPRSDDREFIACGIFDWRALYVAPLGLHAANLDENAAGDAFERDESDALDAVIPGDALPPAAKGLVPMRQLLLTKGEPHRQQIGRIVERVNAIGTMRLFALRNWGTIQNASIYVRLIGEQLDGVLAFWSAQRNLIDKLFPTELERLGHKPASDQPVPSSKSQLRKDKRVAALNELIGLTERRLIEISASLDKNIGQGGSGRLLYVINRSTFFVNEFKRLLETLNIDNIDTWVTYRQFVDRGIAPIFDQIERTGGRLISLRTRLQSVTEMVQTGALIVQTEATQYNTQTLRRIATNGTATQFGIVGVTVGLALQVIQAEKQSLERILALKFENSAELLAGILLGYAALQFLYTIWTTIRRRLEDR